MKIGLIAVDNHNFPDLTLMKISAYHKAVGDKVEWYDTFSDIYDIVYMSKIFLFSPDYQYIINAHKVICGGSGYHIKLIDGKERWIDNPKTQYELWNCLPSEMEHTYPDYSLYNITDTAYGYLTRGCPRGCGFCHVKSKEGLKSYKVADLSEFWRGQKNIVLCDPNLLASAECNDLLQQLIDSKAWVNINQGFDIRLINESNIDLLNQIKIKEIHFAWDNYRDKDLILSNLQFYKEHAKRQPHSHNAIVYVLCNYNSTFYQDLERIYTLRDMGYWAYVMIYNVKFCDKKYKKLQRWCNNKFIFAKCKKFEDYEG